MSKPKSNKHGGGSEHTTRPRKSGPAPHCRYCTKKLPRHKPAPLHFCNTTCQASFAT